MLPLQALHVMTLIRVNEQLEYSPAEESLQEH